ncbi:hypothetical protein T492DRAFT_1051431 [Pavlovales sp. CCMP2436]|nr:hypothetical protein T492DRAFT_1051431 [Pavlovales sp. CCMP2436]
MLAAWLVAFALSALSGGSTGPGGGPPRPPPRRARAMQRVPIEPLVSVKNRGDIEECTLPRSVMETSQKAALATMEALNRGYSRLQINLRSTEEPLAFGLGEAAFSPLCEVLNSVAHVLATRGDRVRLFFSSVALAEHALKVNNLQANKRTVLLVNPELEAIVDIVPVAGQRIRPMFMSDFVHAFHYEVARRRVPGGELPVIALYRTFPLDWRVYRKGSSSTWFEHVLTTSKLPRESQLEAIVAPTMRHRAPPPRRPGRDAAAPEGDKSAGSAQ